MKANEKLKGAELPAIEGGSPALDNWPPHPQRWGQPELARLSQMTGQSSLFYWNGPQTAAMTEAFQGHYPLRHVMPCSSGTAALHIAVTAGGVGPGDEVIVPPLTDMGSLIGILYQQAVPVFADVEPYSCNLRVSDTEKKLTSRTKAIMPVHFGGNPCDMDGFEELASRHSLILIEDCAQSWGALSKGRPVGTMGSIGCYSLNDFKHLSCGDGGIAATDDDEIGARLQPCGDKGYDRLKGVRNPEFLAPNYRMSEPQAAVSTAQMERLPMIAQNRQRIGTRLNERLGDLPGFHPPQVDPEDYCTFWFYLFRIDPHSFRCSRDELVSALKAEGVKAKASYTKVPVYRWPVFQNHAFFGGRWPLKEMGLTGMDYREVCCPVAEDILKTSIRVSVHEGMDDSFVDQLADAIEKVVRYYAV